jgi:hypothetical protein
MRFIYYYTGTVNGENAVGHYIRSLVSITNCQRTYVFSAGCAGTFWGTLGRTPPRTPRSQTAQARVAAAAMRAASRSVIASFKGNAPIRRSAASAKVLLNYLFAP